MSGALFVKESVSRRDTEHIECLNNVKHLSLGTMLYETEHRHFPPAFIADENGKRLHSWRVLILPYIDQKPLYDQYDFDETWDGPSNIKLLDKSPFVFQCPNSKYDGKTTYKLVTGPGTAFVGDQTSGYGDVEDGSSNTLMIVEDFAKPIPWTKPDDLSIDDVVGIMEQSNLVRRTACCAHEANSTFGKACIGTCVSLLDGSTHLISPMSDPQQIRPLCTIDDGESVWLDKLETSQHGFRKPEAWYLLVIYVVLLLLPGWVLFRRRR